MKPRKELGYKENELLATFLTDFKIRKQEKLFWSVVMGIIGQSYGKLKEIPESEQVEVLHFLQKAEKDGII